MEDSQRLCKPSLCMLPSDLSLGGRLGFFSKPIKPFVSRNFEKEEISVTAAVKPMSLLQIQKSQEGEDEEKSTITMELSRSFEAKSETFTIDNEISSTAFSEIEGKELIFYNFMGISETEELEVSQVEGPAAKNQHEYEEVSTELEFGYGASITKKRKPSESYGNLSVPSRTCGVKRMKIKNHEENNGVSLNLRLGPDPWVIKKRIEASDIGNLSRLLLATDLVKKHILQLWDATRIEAIKNGVRVTVWDWDTKSEHQLLFKQWPSNGGYVFIDKWTKKFVKRRGLNIGDEIGLFWDQNSSRFNFSILKRALIN